MIYLHHLADWPKFTWDSDIICSNLASLRYKQGLLMGQLERYEAEARAEFSLETIAL
ncbi:MAG: DUF4172 domain-containing protein [Desulfovibrio sp.]|nr:DUF4172 domain-containing protein [Desulfovibrio sp.]